MFIRLTPANEYLKDTIAIPFVSPQYNPYQPAQTKKVPPMNLERNQKGRFYPKGRDDAGKLQLTPQQKPQPNPLQNVNPVEYIDPQEKTQLQNNLVQFSNLCQDAQNGVSTLLDDLKRKYKQIADAFQIFNKLRPYSKSVGQTLHSLNQRMTDPSFLWNIYQNQNELNEATNTLQQAIALRQTRTSLFIQYIYDAFKRISNLFNPQLSTASSEALEQFIKTAQIAPNAPSAPVGHIINQIPGAHQQLMELITTLKHHAQQVNLLLPKLEGALAEQQSSQNPASSSFWNQPGPITPNPVTPNANPPQQPMPI